MREVGGEILGHAVDEIILLGIAAEVRERQHDDGASRGAELRPSCQPLLVAQARPIQTTRIGAAGRAMFLEVLFAQIGELKSEPGSDLIVDEA